MGEQVTQFEDPEFREARARLAHALPQDRPHAKTPRAWTLVGLEARDPLARRLDRRLASRGTLHARVLADVPLAARIAVDGVEGAIDVAPTDADSRVVPLDLGMPLYRALVAAVGVDPADEETTRWVKEGTEAMRAHMADAPTSPVALLAGAADVHLEMIGALGRAFLMPYREISEVLGREYRPARSLMRPGGRAAALARAAVQWEEARRETELAAERARVEAARPRSLAELGVTVIAVDRDGREFGLHRTLREMGVWAETERAWLYAFRLEPGITLADAAERGIRVLPNDTLAPPGAKPHAVKFLDLAVLALADDLHAAAGQQRDLGPVDRWADEVPKIARSIASDAARWFGAIVPVTLWRRALASEQIVRGCRVHPVDAVQVIAEAWRALDGRGPSDDDLAVLEASCVAAARAGRWIGVGVGVDPVAEAPPTTFTAGKKAKR